MSRPVFLSASVPDRKPFTTDLDPLAIREAVIALVSVTVRQRELVFGGHPAISPLVEHAARSLGAMDRVHIYQAPLFKDRMPEAAKQFPNLHWSARRENEADSLKELRKEMIGARDFCCAVFVGGMEGIFDEAELFRNMHPSSPLLPVGSTGGATAQLLEAMREQFVGSVYHLLKDEQRYRKVFRELLPGD